MVSFYMVALVISNQFKLLSELPFQFLLTDTNLKPAKFVVHLIVWARFSFAEISSWILVMMLIESVVSSRLKTLTQIPSWSPNYTLARLAIFTFIYLAFFVKNFILIIVDGDLAFYFDCSVLFARLEDCQVDNPEFLASYAWFYYCYQMSYCYVPILVAVVFNGALMYTLYQLKYKPLLFSGRARMDKIKRVETYAKVCYFFKFFRLI
jgi:hypothetical protein